MHNFAPFYGFKSLFDRVDQFEPVGSGTTSHQKVQVFVHSKMKK